MDGNEEKIIPKYIGENIERSKKKNRIIDEIIGGLDFFVLETEEEYLAMEDIKRKLEELKKL